MQEMIRREKRFFTQTIKIFCKWSGSIVALFYSPTAASALYSTHVQMSTFLCLSVFYLILTHSYSDGCILGSYLAQAYFKPSADASLHLAPPPAAGFPGSSLFASQPLTVGTDVSCAEWASK